MNCPNDRYVNDAAICQAVAAMLAKIDVKVNLMVETKATYFPKILSRDTSFYLLGWTPASYDAHNRFAILMSPGPSGHGQFNLGGYANKRVDELRAADRKRDSIQQKREAMIHELYKLHADDIGHIPLHQQALAWAMKQDVDLVQLADDFNFLKWVVVR